jgi:hypothetical protein
MKIETILMLIRVTMVVAEGKATRSKNLISTRTSMHRKRKRHQSPEAEENRYTE